MITSCSCVVLCNAAFVHAFPSFTQRPGVTNLLLDLVLLVVLRHAEQHDVQLAEVELHGLEEADGNSRPQQVAAGKVPGAEVHGNEADVPLVLVLRRPHGLVEEQPSNKSQEGGLPEWAGP